MADPILIPVDHDPFVDLPQGPTELRQGPMGLRDWLPFVGAAVKQYATDKIHGAVDAVTLPGDLVQGKADLATPEGMERAQNLVGMLPVGGIGMAEQGAAGVFGGRLAANADPKAYSRARDMIFARAPKEQILNDTGVFSGTEGILRHEISDVGAKMNYPPEAFDVGGHYKLGDVLHHPELFKAYPELGDMLVKVLPTDSSGQLGGFSSHWRVGEDGQYSPARTIGDISLQQKVLQDPSVLLHEIQHAVQHVEGFQNGGNPGEQIHKELPQFNNYQILKAADQYQQAIANGEMTKNRAKLLLEGNGDQGKQIAKLLDADPQQIKDLRVKYAQKIPLDAYAGYSRLAGEVEARNVSDRYQMSQAFGQNSLQKYPPWITQDTPRGQQILRGPNSQFSLVPVSHDPFEGAQ